MTRPFSKPWLPVPDQIALLKKRRLVIEDASVAQVALMHVNYYRLSCYSYPFRATSRGNHIFPTGTRFADLLSLYRFDGRLRQTLAHAIAFVEIDLRAAIARQIAEAHGPFGHTTSRNFVQKPGTSRQRGSRPPKRVVSHAKWLKRLREDARHSREEFVEHFRTTYDESPDLPIWMATELMTFGSLSKLIEMMLKPDLKPVAARYGLQPNVLISWSHHLTYVRNVCAHHSRLWDRIWSIPPAVRPGKDWTTSMVPTQKRLYVTLLILSYMLHQALPAADETGAWRTSVQALIDGCPLVPDARRKMGLPERWDHHPAWEA